MSLVSDLQVRARAGAIATLRLTAPGRSFLRWHGRRRFWAPGPDDGAHTDFYRHFISPGDLVFDVGANRGFRSRLFHLLGARIVAFEPQPGLAAKLRETFHGTPTHIVEAAVGDVACASMPMYVNSADLLSTLSPEWIAAMKRSERFRGMETWEGRPPISVPVVTLDGAIAEHGVPVFTKIDVEGYELQVLKGLNRAVPALSLEFLTETLDTTRACLSRLASLGEYRFQVSLGESMQFALPDWLTIPETFSYFDNTLARQTGGWGDIYARLAVPPGRSQA